MRESVDGVNKQKFEFEKLLLQSQEECQKLSRQLELISQEYDHVKKTKLN